MSKYTAMAITLTLATWLLTVIAIAVTGISPYDPTSHASETRYRVVAAAEDQRMPDMRLDGSSRVFDLGNSIR